MAVVGILGCGAFLIFCFLIVAIFVAYRVGRENGLGLRRSNSIFEPAAPPRLAGKIERVGDAPGGWSVYKLSGYGLSIELPTAPQQSEMDPDSWAPRQKRNIETYSGYEALYPSARIDFDGYIYRMAFPSSDTAWVIRGDMEKTRRRGESQDLKETHHLRTVDGQAAMEVDYTYVYGGQPSVSRELLIMGPRSVRTISFTYWKRQDEAASVDFDQCVNSIKFLPPAEDKYGHVSAR